MTYLLKNRTGLDQTLNEFPTFFDDLFARNSSFNAHKLNGTLPAVNIKETDSNFEIELAVPGMEKSDFKIDLKKNQMTISAQKESKNENSQNEKFFLKEFSFKSFSRSFTLPQDAINSDQISATYDNGILKVTLPKADKQEQVKQINIL